MIEAIVEFHLCIVSVETAEHALRTNFGYRLLRLKKKASGTHTDGTEYQLPLIEHLYSACSPFSSPSSRYGMLNGVQHAVPIGFKDE